jgi:hypothetical protein
MEASLNRIGREIDTRQAEAAMLRKQVAAEVAKREAKRSAAATPSPMHASEIGKLRKNIAEAEKFIGDLPDSKRPHILPAAHGDRKALDALDKIAGTEAKARDSIALATAAIAEIESQNAETQRKSAERDADEKHRAGLVAADAIISWSLEFDRHLNELAVHFEKLPELQRALAKSGASINTDLTNRIYTAASRDRAAKAANLHRCFSLDATVQAAPLGETFKSLLKAAVRRPDIERKIAS